MDRRKPIVRLTVSFDPYTCKQRRDNSGPYCPYFPYTPFRLSRRQFLRPMIEVSTKVKQNEGKP